MALRSVVRRIKLDLGVVTVGVGVIAGGLGRGSSGSVGSCICSSDSHSNFNGFSGFTRRENFSPIFWSESKTIDTIPRIRTGTNEESKWTCTPWRSCGRRLSTSSLGIISRNFMITWLRSMVRGKSTGYMSVKRVKCDATSKRHPTAQPLGVNFRGESTDLK